MSNIVNIPVIQIPSTAFFPNTILPLYITHPHLICMIKELVTQKTPGLIGVQMEEARQFGQNATICGAGIPVILEELPEGHLKIAVHGVMRVRLIHMTQHIPYQAYDAIEIPDISNTSSFANSEIEELRDLLTQWLVSNVRNSSERDTFIDTLKKIDQYIDYLSMFLIKDLEMKQNLLANPSLKERINILRLILRPGDAQDPLNFQEDLLAIDAIKDYQQMIRFEKLGH